MLLSGEAIQARNILANAVAQNFRNASEQSLPASCSKALTVNQIRMSRLHGLKRSSVVSVNSTRARSRPFRGSKFAANCSLA